MLETVLSDRSLGIKDNLSTHHSRETKAALSQIYSHRPRGWRTPYGKLSPVGTVTTIRREKKPTHEQAEIAALLAVGVNTGRL